jgi:hypothetical protein
MFIRNTHEGPITEQGVLRDVAIPATLDFCQKNRALSDKAEYDSCENF